MLDVARHFFGPDDIKRYIDLLALYKFNHLHLHLSDDQGWRIEIASWPNLTTHGGSTAVGGGPWRLLHEEGLRGSRGLRARHGLSPIVPEIDMPSHINAALSSYPELNCDGKAPPLYTGIEVGFSAFCVDKDITYKFIDDVVREIAAMTPGPYFHIGGDEVKTFTPAQYKQFIERVQADREAPRQAGDRLGRDRARDPAAEHRRAVLASGRVDRAAARDESSCCPGEQGLSRHEVRRDHGAWPEMGGSGGRVDAVRVGSGDAPAIRPGKRDPGHRVSDLVGDARRR